MESLRALYLGALLLVGGSAAAQTTPLPRILESKGRRELLIDSAPFLMLGGQTDYGLNLTRPVLLKVRMGIYR